jgi:hypothetical protein
VGKQSHSAKAIYENPDQVLNFEHLNFEFVSDFDIRISDLSPHSTNPNLPQHQCNQVLSRIFRDKDRKYIFLCDSSRNQRFRDLFGLKNLGSGGFEFFQDQKSSVLTDWRFFCFKTSSVSLFRLLTRGCFGKRPLMKTKIREKKKKVHKKIKRVIIWKETADDSLYIPPPCPWRNE